MSRGGGGFGLNPNRKAVAIGPRPPKGSTMKQPMTIDDFDTFWCQTEIARRNEWEPAHVVRLQSRRQQLLVTSQLLSFTVLVSFSFLISHRIYSARDCLHQKLAFMSSSMELRRRPPKPPISTGADETSTPAPKNNSVSDYEIKSHHSRFPLLFITSWAVVISFFLVVNYDSGPWPTCLLTSNRDVWRLVHAISSMLFGGTIVVSTILEWMVVSSKNPTVIIFWFYQVPALDGAIVMPALTGSILSGVAQAAQDYGSLKESPKYIKGSLHVLLTFAIWWAMTDITTQHLAQQTVMEWVNAAHDDKNSAVPRVIRLRRWSNIGSCLFVAALYALMALKRGSSSTE